ncbi:MAG: hypothetical protein M1305_00690 [Candidatus Marsarchaeota archaeon]|nr:hypothetical protein [Candidatus Marsarchaeota archaeon]
MGSESEVIEQLLPIARRLVRGPCVRRSLAAGYDIKPGERALLVVNSFYDEVVVETMTIALREAGARVDRITLDMGPDRPLEEIDELTGFIHNWPGIEEKNPLRTWIERTRWAEKVASEQKYDIMIHLIGGPVPSTEFAQYRYEGFPWITSDIFSAALFPHEVWDKINAKTWEPVWGKGRGGKVRITDLEGTDISFTLLDEYYDPSRRERTGPSREFTEIPFFGHLHMRPTSTTSWNEDSHGVISGTTNHTGRPFPHIKVHIEKGKLVSVEGGGKYGDAWRAMLEATKGIQYPGYPDKGLFWWWEAGTGTNPKMSRPANAFRVSGGGTVFERLRSGVIHCGIGTGIYSPAEEWATQAGVPYGHMHVHLLFATYEITCRNGETVKLIDRGRLTALDDPEVIETASKYGDPKEILKMDWIPPIPGISVEGDYWKDYASDPYAWLKKNTNML